MVERYALLLEDRAGAPEPPAGVAADRTQGAGSASAPDAGALALGSPLAELGELRERVERLERELAALSAGRKASMRNPSECTADDDPSRLDPRR
jgi:hypothetical protein